MRPWGQAEEAKAVRPTRASKSILTQRFRHIRPLLPSSRSSHYLAFDNHEHRGDRMLAERIHRPSGHHDVAQAVGPIGQAFRHGDVIDIACRLRPDCTREGGKGPLQSAPRKGAEGQLLQPVGVFSGDGNVRASASMTACGSTMRYSLC